MKRKILSGSLLGVLLSLGVMLGISEPAQANTYPSCSAYNSMIPPPVGDIIITNTGACSLNAVNVTTGSFTVDSTGSITASSVQATGSFTLRANGGALTATDVTASGGSVFLKASSGAVTAANITGNESVARSTPIESGVEVWQYELSLRAVRVN